MFKKEQNAIPKWSLDNVKLCAKRQSEILDCAAEMLAGGGRIVYSTCTFAPEEDEEQIKNFLSRHAEFKLLKQEKLLPHKVKGEGHFCAVLEKTAGGRNDLKLRKRETRENSAVKLYREWEVNSLNIKLDKIFFVNNRFYSFCDGAPDTDYWAKYNIFPHSRGLLLGEISYDGKRFEPSHTFAMSLKRSEVKNIDVDEKTALSYLRGLTFDCDPAQKGWRVVTHLGYPLGWCKAVNGTAKNHLPKGLRI